MSIQTTMTGSWFRPAEIIQLLNPEKSPSGEISEEHSKVVEDAERRAVRDQLHPLGSKKGLDWISNGEQRKAGYTFYIPNRFYGFSKREKVVMSFPATLQEEWKESNPSVLQLRQAAFQVPKIEDRLQYHGEKLAKKEAEDFKRIAKEEKAERIFLNTTSPGVITIFFPRSEVYHDHYDYLFSLAKEMRKEYQAIVGEMANPRHQGDALLLESYLKEHHWPKSMKFAEGVIDVKSPIVETPETVAARLDRMARLDKIGPENLLGGTDCGFETFASMGNVTYQVGLMKLKALVEGAELESKLVSG